MLSILSGDEMFLRRTAERAVVGMKADHVEAADQADVLLAFYMVGSECSALALTVSVGTRRVWETKRHMTNGIIYRFFATVRYHNKPRKGRKRIGQRVELWVFPTHVPRKDWRDDPEAVGGVWTEQGRLFGTLSIPADTFYSLFPCLTSNHFKELQLGILRMHYRQGDLDGIRFAPKETPMEDLVSRFVTTKKGTLVRNQMCLIKFPRRPWSPSGVPILETDKMAKYRNHY